jgi:hypothetical protein
LDFYFNRPDDFLVHAQADWPYVTYNLRGGQLIHSDAVKLISVTAAFPSNTVEDKHHLLHIENSRHNHQVFLAENVSTSSKGVVEQSYQVAYPPHARGRSDNDHQLVVLNIMS